MTAFAALIAKDVRLLVRSRSVVAALGFFAFVLVVVSSFAFRRVGYGPAELRSITPGIIWLVFLFTGVVLLNHSFVEERENHSLLGIVLSGISLEYVMFSKIVVLGFSLLFVQGFVWLVHSLLFGVPVGEYWHELAIISVLVTIAFVSIGSLFAAIAAVTPRREILLPIILFPVSIPLVGAAVQLTDDVLLHNGIIYGDFWFVLLCAFAVIGLTSSLMLFPALCKD